MGLFKHDSDARLDRLAMHLGLTMRLLENGSVGISVKDQLRALNAALDDVVDDDELKDGAFVQRVVPLAGEAQVPQQRLFHAVDTRASA
ncbi:MAG: hypothetical protein QOG53_186 [Frankiales bacterium]|jgi:hypothetical protein|nr:hypothetical protein [Frankiales bacterium]